MLSARLLLSSLTRCLCNTVSMTSPLEDYFSPPKVVRGSKSLDRAAFQRCFELPAVKSVKPSLCSLFLKRLSHAYLRYPYIKTVLDEEGDNAGKELTTTSTTTATTKVILLAPPHLMKQPLTSEDHQWIAENGGEEATHMVTLCYTDYSKHAILRAILPQEVKEVPSGFETVGHIAHFNLREEHLPYKDIIGQVTLDRQPKLRTVVNKTDQIDSTFRFFKMEVLAGEEDLLATVKENHCTFTFDFSTVYWNSRLSKEHERLVDLLRGTDVVLDMFAGVGPFAIPAAKNKGCTVYANDLNPHAHKYLVENAQRNHVASRVHAYNLDGREFLVSITRDLVRRALEATKEGKITAYSHVIMNLPASAVEFLNAFRGLFNFVPEEFRSCLELPLVHCYCFAKGGSEAEQEEAALLQVSTHLGVSELVRDSHLVEMVRSVAPKKNMLRVSFTLPSEVAFWSNEEQIDNRENLEEPSSKRYKLDVVEEVKTER